MVWAGKSLEKRFQEFLFSARYEFMRINMNGISPKRLLCKTGMLLGLIVLLTACASNNGTGTTTASPTAHTRGTTTVGAVGLTPSPGIRLGPQACPDAVKAPSYWDLIVPTQPNVSQVKSVTCGYLKGVPTLQALVTVLYDGAGSVLDVYVYDNITAAQPTQLFKLQNLYKGSAKISGYNTVLTAEVDQASSENNGKANDALVPDLFREFKWSDGAGTLAQIAFPGIFPDLTRYQAEDDQAQVNQGNQPWKLNATMTAQAFGASLLHWSANAPATVTSGGGSHDAQAVVKLRNTSPGGDGVTLSMTRLEGNTNGGIWIITDVSSAGLSVTQPQSQSLIHSSVTVTGTGSAFEGVIGQVTILDHLYTNIGQAQVRGASGNGSTTFSTNVSCQPTFKIGAQEGLVMVSATSNAGGGIEGAVIVKVLIMP
jgi:hypothetical protein